MCVGVEGWKGGEGCVCMNSCFSQSVMLIFADTDHAHFKMFHLGSPPKNKYYLQLGDKCDC